MYKTFNLKVSLSIILISVLMGASSSSLFMLWIFMELNMLGSLPMMSLSSSKFTNSLKYFVSQALGSILVFLSLVLFSSHFSPYYVLMWSALGILWKLGAFPFHLWFLNTAMELDWTMFFFLSTIQKILPMLMLTSCFHPSVLWSAGFGVLLVSFGTFNQSNLKKMFIYSSIFSLSWMLVSLAFFENMWMVLLLIYSVVLISIVSMFSEANSDQAFSSILLSMTESNKTILLVSLLVLGGIPPFAGFLMKLLLLKIIAMAFWFVISVFLTISAVYVMFMYLMFSINMFMLTEIFISGARQTPKMKLLLWSSLMMCSVDFFMIL